MRRRWENASTGRYYEAEVLHNLFGDLEVLTVWGGIGSLRGSHRYEPVSDAIAAEQLLKRIAKRRAKRRYE